MEEEPKPRTGPPKKERRIFQSTVASARFQELKKALITCVFQERLMYRHVIRELSMGILREAQLRTENPYQAAALVGTSSNVINHPRNKPRQEEIPQ